MMTCKFTKRWQEARDYELNQMGLHNVWKKRPETLATGTNVMGCRWVFLAKLKPMALLVNTEQGL